ncbi:response regulator [Bdellovibrio sp. HCB185ZH]|uniref:response regulator n=1 Tax=Bdellovibrio sp. HCB185ZH TaxID=3394235 RepID=UPI0039A73154
MKKILAADDNPVNQLILRGLLARLGYEFTIVENGHFAVEAAQSQSFDLILMDCHMPEMDGYLATQKIRGISSYAEVPIIAMTASGLTDEKERCLQVGMTDYIAKPLDVVKIEAVLRKYII